MEIKILCPLWGQEHLALTAFLGKIKNAGFDGVDTWIPGNKADRKKLFDYLQAHQLHIVAHQHQASGANFEEFKKSFLHNLYLCAEPGPILINSHTGRDWFTLDQSLELIETARNFTDKSGIEVVHETHRGRIGFCPQMAEKLFERCPHYLITADFSHWTCVTESLLESFESIINIAISRTRHIHARVGYENGPQIPDPRAPEWHYAVNAFTNWWDKIIEFNRQTDRKFFTITTEFGPPPYMPTVPFNRSPVADQFEVNCFMKNMLQDRYAS
jgi:sugar phosphate isomerase/epimerase